MKTYYEGCNAKLLAQIPPGRRKVLELGCAAGLLGWHYKQEFPAAQWHGVDIAAEALEAARARLDEVHLLHLDREGLAAVGTGFDCVVMGDLLEHLAAPERVLAELRAITTPDASLICCVPNMGHGSVIEKLVAADLDYDDNGLLDRTHLRFFTKSSLLKMFLDAGWSPRIADQYATANHANGRFLRGILDAAAAIGVPERIALANFNAYQYIVECARIEASAAPPSLPLSVIVPMNNPLQFASNVARSPGLRELGAQVIVCRGASSAADAFEKGRALAQHEWMLYCHQDVYFPKGFGSALQAHLARMGERERRRSVVGFAGIALGADGRPAHSGAVIDRGARFCHPTSARAVSLDELAVVIHRDCELRIDAQLGWHLWATDLCLQGICTPGGAVYAATVGESVLHNSHSDFVLPEAFHHSARLLAAKYPQFVPIPTLCGTIGIERDA